VGGKGCDPVLDADTADCRKAGVFDPDARGTGDRFVDHVFGGVGESVTAQQDVLGSDLLDLNPRGAYPGNCAPGAWPVTTDGVTVDPCLWFRSPTRTTTPRRRRPWRTTSTTRARTGSTAAGTAT
jgi:hypothetical protein